MTQLMARSPALMGNQNFESYTDFAWYITNHEWSSILTTTGAAATISTTSGLQAGGWAKLTTGTTATANGESGVSGVNKIFLPASNKPLYFEASVTTTEANATNLGFCAGFSSAHAAGALIDTTGGLVVAGGTWVQFYKDLNSQNIYVACSVATTQQATKTSTTVPAAATNFVFGIEIVPISSTVADVTYTINGVQAKDNTSLLPVKHQWVYTSAIAMSAGVNTKGFSTTNEVTYVDYIYGGQKR